MFSNPDIIPSLAALRARDLAVEADQHRRSDAMRRASTRGRRRAQPAANPPARPAPAVDQPARPAPAVDQPAKPAAAVALAVGCAKE